MKLATGNMFDHPASLILVTTNSFVRSNGELVMGRGAAAELRRHMPNAERIFGTKVWARSQRRSNLQTDYGVIVCPPYGIFQAKHHWGKPAVPELIAYSVSCLQSIARNYHSISLNYPGIGNGGLTREAVWPLIQGLPDNVTVWEKG